MNKKSSKQSTSNENYSHLELFNLGKIFFKEKKFIDFRSRENRSGFEAINDINPVSYTHLTLPTIVRV